MTLPDGSSIALADRVVRSARMLSAEIDGEVVALDIAKGACYGLDAVGAHIWALIETPTAVADVCQALTALYDVDVDTCRGDVLDLFADLHAEGLIEVDASHPPSAS